MNQLHRDAVVVDCHNDQPFIRGMWHRDIGEPDHFGQVSIPELRDGGVDVQVMPIYTRPQQAEASLRHGLLMIEYLYEEVQKNQDQVALCLTGAAIDRAVADGKLALLLSIEGASALGADVQLLRTFFRLGVRMVSFTHFERTLLGDGSAEDATGSRLPSTGVAALQEMERLGILMDVSHLGIDATAHVLDLATRPVIASHSSARALYDYHRNLSDDQLRRIAATGGVIGVNFIPVFLGPDQADYTLDRLIEHIDHIAEVAGIDHIGLGPDFIADVYDEQYPTREVPLKGLNPKARLEGLGGTRDLPNLTEALLRRNWSEANLRKLLGENFLRVFRQVCGVPG